MDTNSSVFEETVRIDTGTDYIYGTFTIPDHAYGAVVFAHGSGSSRHSPRNRFVARSLQRHGLATLLVDLLTPAEERVDSFTAQHRFDIDLLTHRLSLATDWLGHNRAEREFPIGYFGASTGAAAALKAAAERPDIAAVVSRGGRPDLAGEALPRVTAATLLVVGGLDRPVIDLNRAAYERLTRAFCRELVIIPDATHLFEEAGALEEVAQWAAQWFVRYLGAAANHHLESSGGSRGTSPTRSIHRIGSNR
jgi:dienelactone hydrolase